MPVDEFGREIPTEVVRRRRSNSPRSGGGGGGGGSGSAFNGSPLSSFQTYQPSAPSYYHGGPSHPSAAAERRAFEEPHPSSQPLQSQQQPPPIQTSGGASISSVGSGGGGGGGPPYHSHHQHHQPPPPPQPHHQYHNGPPPPHRSPHHRGGYGGGRGGGFGYRGGGGRGSPGNYARRGGGGGPYGPSSLYSSPPKPFFNGNNALGGRPSGGGGVGPNTSSNNTPNAAANTPHPSTRYMSTPMLCGYLWKQDNIPSLEKKKDADTAKEGNAGEETTEGNNDTNYDNNDYNQNNTDGTDERLGEEDSQHQQAQDNMKSEDDEDVKKEKTEKAYTAYRRSYCDNYLKHVFNAHLDDSWFRQLFSPLARYESAKSERQRSHAEAKALLEEVQTWRSNPLKNQTLETTLSLTAPDEEASSSSRALLLPPRFHVPRAVREGCLLQVKDVPSHVTNTQLWHALPPSSGWIHHAAKNDEGDKQQQQQQAALQPDGVLQLFSSMPQQTHHTRTVFWLSPNRQTCDALWQAFVALDGRAAPAPDAQLSVAWEVDCQDPYRRTEYDVDNRGGAPEDGLGVPNRKAVLNIVPYTDTTAVTVLTAALSQLSRIPEDARAATTLARALDVQQHIPEPCQLDTILEKAEQIWSEEGETKDMDPQSVRLDLTLAYLRRVHHVNFYKGCQKAEFFGDVLAGHEAASSLQYRAMVQPEEEESPESGALAVAPDGTAEPAARESVKDEIEEGDGKEENGEKESQDGGDDDPAPAPTPAPPPTKDLLVQRLDDAIDQALNVTCHEWIASADSVVDRNTDAAAEDLRRAEDDAEEDWLQNHSIDDEGRARCSFHFCHKLFKDQNFLRKHLKKKHYEYCKAEQAKCHDVYMMKAWERAGASRPRPSNATGPPRLIVPDILVDCGTKYGCIPAALYHATTKKKKLPDEEAGEYGDDTDGDESSVVVVVDVVDPEPALWQKEQEQERIEREKRQAVEEMRQRRRDESRQQRMAQPITPRKDNFVDVDDMKEEVVTMTFDQVELPQPKKKKKKRKLL